MQLYVINLDRATDRLQHMQAQMQELGLRFTRVPAVDGRDLDSAQLASLHENRESDYGSWLFCETLSEAACNLSHAKALELIAAGPDEYGVVLEDDAILAKSSVEFLQDSSWIPAHTALIKIDKGAVKNVLLEHLVDINQDYALYKRLSSSYMAAGYIISRETARRLAKILQTTPFLVDAVYYSFECGMARELQVLQLYPAIVHWAHKELPSQIAHPRKKRKWNKNRLLYLYRRWRSYSGKNWRFGTHYRWGKVPFVK